MKLNIAKINSDLFCQTNGASIHGSRSSNSKSSKIYPKLINHTNTLLSRTLLITIPVITFFIIAALLLSIFSSNSHASRTLIVAHEQNHPMASTNKDGKSQGILIDVLDEVARREGWEIIYKPCLWAKCMEALERGDADLLVAIAYTPERAKKYSYNSHTVISNWGLLYSRPDKKIETYSDLNGKRIAIVKNDVYCTEFMRLLQQFNIKCDIVYADNFKDIFSKITTGEVDAGVANRFFSLLNERNFKVKATQIIFSPVSVQVAAPLGRNADILKAFDRQLEDMMKDRNSVYHASLRRWLGIESAGYRIPRWLIWAGVSLLGGAIILSAFVWLLKMEVRRKTYELRKLTTAVEQSANSVIITDTKGMIEYVNPRFCKITGYKPEEVLGQRPSILKSGNQSSDIYANLWKTITSGEEWSGELSNKKKDGTIFWEICSIAPVRDNNGATTHYVAIKEDITARKTQEEILTWQASHDTMTGLYNRFYLETQLSSKLMRINRDTEQLSVMLLNIDNMKFVNDTFGHDFGDQLLKLISIRIKECTCNESIVSRFIGDEFVICTPAMPIDANSCHLAQKLKEKISAPFVVDGAEIIMTVSIGVATYPDAGENVDCLIRNAETAMYEAKKQGRNTFVCFSEEFSGRVQHRLILDARLHKALEHDEFSLHYQPQINSRSGIIKGVEALLRWTPADMQPVSPIEFIPILEESCLIVSVGTWVIHEACSQMVRWQQCGFPQLKVSVNISAVQLQRSDFADTVKTILKDTGLDPSLLCLELTESTLMIDTAQTIMKLHQLRQLGVTLSLDDFGTGYSSLSYLSRLPVQELKVDQSFVKRINMTHTDTAVVNTIVAMAQELGLELVAEGVETEEQKEHLMERGCETTQGFLYSRPLTPQKLQEFVLKNIKEKDGP